MMLNLALSALWGVWGSAEALPRPEHPRPDFRRERWVNLNGIWEFEFDPKNEGLQEQWARTKREWSRTLRVPFPWQAPLSGVADVEYQGAAWYRRTFTVPPEWRGWRVFLRFGAVDWFAQVWVNGDFVGEHEGGYSPFEFDITDFLREGQQTLVVRAFDDTSPEQPNGKQTGWYTRTGGIWQTVWLEARPSTYLDRIHFVPLPGPPGQGQVLAKVRLFADRAGMARLRFETEDPPEPPKQWAASLPTPQVFDLTYPAGFSEHTLLLRVPEPRFWHPETPYLYFVRVTLEPVAGRMDTVLGMDVVHTYFGWRTVGVGQFAGQDFTFIALNGKPLYLLGALDQAFHPEGIYTYPSEEVLRGDLERAKEFGLNFLRIHIKVDEPRFLYWADRLGVALMCDMPNFQTYTETARRRWEQTLREAIERDFNHPAIIAWCLFNETWGLGGNDYKQQRDRQLWVRAMVNLARRLDPTRLVEDNSVCLYDHVETDINSWHFYINDYEAARNHIAHVVANTFPGSSFNFAPGWKQGHQPLINSEYGGISAGSGDQDISWCFKYLTNELRKHAKIGGYVYTELMDIEWEHNGFMNYDRTVKEFGYEEVSPGFSLRDLNNPDFLVLDAPPHRIAEPGSLVETPVAFSHFSSNPTERGRLRWRLDGWDAFGERREGLDAGQREVSFRRWTVTPFGTITVRLPQERMLLTLTAWLEAEDGAVLARNYLNLETRRPLPRRELLDERTLALRWEPGEFAQTSWREMFLYAQRMPEKVWGQGRGFFEFRLRWPEGLDPSTLQGGILLLEAAAKAGKEKVEWPRYKPVDYPQTDRTKWPTTLRVLVNGEVVHTQILPDDPADARGVLSHAAKFHPGSYGYLVRVSLPLEVLQRDREGLSLRLEVPEGAEPAGGLALFGDALGRYPLDPTLILRTRIPLRKEQVLGDGSSVAVVGERPVRLLVPTAEWGGARWRYTEKQPPQGWEQPGFDDSGWAEGTGGFGREGTPGAIVRTRWHSNNIWLRTTFRLESLPRSALLRFHHDEDVEIFLNGHPLLQEKGYLTEYTERTLSPKALDLLRVGENVLAVHCRQTVGGQYIDVGLLGLMEE